MLADDKKKMKYEAEDNDESGHDSFFETFDRIPSSVSFAFPTHSSDSDSDENACRTSFASAIGDPSEFCRLFSTATTKFRHSSSEDEDNDEDEDDAYAVWMSEPLSIEERRRRLLKGMGLSTSTKQGIAPADSTEPPGPAMPPESATPRAAAVIRSHSDPAMSGTERDTVLPRASSVPAGGSAGAPVVLRALSRRATRMKEAEEDREDPVAFYTIRNLDTGREFVINLENGAWNSRLSDLETGTQITMEEFERSAGHSPIVKELMRREGVGKAVGAGRKGGKKKKKVGWLKNIRCVASSVTSFVAEKEAAGVERTGSRRNGAALLDGSASQNAATVVDGNATAMVDRLGSRNSAMAVDRSGSRSAAAAAVAASASTMKVHRRGKPYKELTGLYMSQEIQAHEGSIWCIRFSADAMYMASAGEDRIIHVWQVLECDTAVPLSRSPAMADVHHHNGSTCGSPERSTTLKLKVNPSAKMRKGKATSGSSKRKESSSVPDHVVVPETVFSLSEKPVCSFQGHLDDVLDLSWSKSQLLLSSSMDKTVRLWDMETQTCLNLFAHNDYVTCIQFNPVDDRYFISGSLDAKVRIWSIPDRQVIDWNDLNEMITAACYTPDGQGALVGSHKGTCRFYTMTDCKLKQKAQIDIHNKKKKSHAKKITGFQFAPGNPSEVLITSADSQIRIYDGVDLIHKFRGFRNTNSQIPASFTPDGSYVVCASEDSHVYLWKRDEHRSSSGKRSYISTRSHENFSCKDVSVAVPWPSSIRYERPSPFPSSRFCPSPVQSPDRGAPPPPSSSSASIMCAPDDPFSSSRIHHPPPVPKRNSPDRVQLSCTDDELRSASRSASSSWLWSGPLSSISSGFSMSSSRWSGSHRNGASRVVTAWGMVVVAAGLGGEIRVYQNFGLPVRLSKQVNLL